MASFAVLPHAIAPSRSLISDPRREADWPSDDVQLAPSCWPKWPTLSAVLTRSKIRVVELRIAEL